MPVIFIMCLQGDQKMQTPIPRALEAWKKQGHTWGLGQDFHGGDGVPVGLQGQAWFDFILKSVPRSCIFTCKILIALEST